MCRERQFSLRGGSSGTERRRRPACSRGGGAEWTERSPLLFGRVKGQTENHLGALGLKPADSRRRRAPAAGLLGREAVEPSVAARAAQVLLAAALEGCALFHDVGLAPPPWRSWWPTRALPSALPSSCRRWIAGRRREGAVELVPVRMSCLFGVRRGR